MEDIPEFSNLDTLSIAYNDLTDIDNLIENVLEKVSIAFHSVPSPAIFESTQESTQPTTSLWVRILTLSVGFSSLKQAYSKKH